MRLLLVEDSPRLTELLRETVHQAGWRIDCAGTLAEARLMVATDAYDLCVLDLGMPDGNGLDLLAAMRAAGSTLPVLVVTAIGDVDSRIAGLDAGADDYLAKPFHHREFLARCRAIARRGTTSAPILSAGRLRYDPASALLTCENTAIALAPRERQLIEILMREVGRVVSKRRLEDALSEAGDVFTTNALEVLVSRLRKRISEVEAGAEIETVRGIGYLLRSTEP
ncbi:DNA-binding response regulator [Fulvimarina endophytica]|uniref:DNA-binding response regulator n=1 Tax=Fulvimarina endophytica TaxID=2293836 RepID=A0A371X5I5_9HYPH|nr:response regulator transcription factor [Fulvimarina endophytica]RFC64482.1 DNA-binding response regulator [Fulvimarina endophytica]